MKKIIIFASEDWHFYGHLLPIAEVAKIKGYDVKILTNISSYRNQIEQHGLSVIPISIKRNGLNPFVDLILIIKLIRILKKEKPDILHNFTIKPIFYGSIAAFLSKANFCEGFSIMRGFIGSFVGKTASVLNINEEFEDKNNYEITHYRETSVINSFLGLGCIIGDTTGSLFLGIIRNIIIKILNMIGYYKPMLFIVQNGDDAKLLKKLCPAQKIITQCCVGIDTKKFSLLSEPIVESVDFGTRTEESMPMSTRRVTSDDVCNVESFDYNGKIVFALVARMIIEKGIYEFIEAAKILKQTGYDAEFWLVGEVDKGNNQSVNLDRIQNYQSKGYIKYLGYQGNIKKIWEQAHVSVLPSYREGLSRSLLEAGGYGRAIITTDAPGGRELIQNLKNGLLVKPKDIESLVRAMELLIINPDLRKQFGEQINKDIIEKYDASHIANKVVQYYSQTP